MTAPHLAVASTKEKMTMTRTAAADRTPEDRLARFTATATAGDAPEEVRQMAVQILRTVIGTAVAGAAQDGIRELRDHLVGQAGVGEARSLVYGDLMPARSAALLNGTMARALDYCDTMVPGLHLGSSVIIAALVAAEVRGGCTGAELLDGLVVGLEVGAQLNLTEEQYAGFDPTGVAGLFGATAAAARILRLDEIQIRDALGLAFNRCSGSFQSNADASLAVRFIQGFTASNAIECVQLAQIGISGPRNFLAGKFGYTRLWGRDQVTAEEMVAGLGESWAILGTFFKKYPCCGLTQGPTESVLTAIDEKGIKAESVERIDLYLPEFAFNLIGKPFESGTNPRVNAQFSAAYCITNAFVRGASTLAHFEPSAVKELEGHPLFDRINVEHDPAITGHSASRLVIQGADGFVWTRELEIGPGYPGNPLTLEEHAHGFDDCLKYAPYPLGQSQVDGLKVLLGAVQDIQDVRELLSHLVSQRTADVMDNQR